MQTAASLLSHVPHYYPELQTDIISVSDVFDQPNAFVQTCGTAYASRSAEVSVCLIASGFVELNASNPGRVYL